MLTLDDLSGEETGTFLDRAFTEIRRRKVSDLVIDLRNCRGGDDKFNNRLLSYLTRRPFRFYAARTFRAQSYDDLKFVDYAIDDFLSPSQLRELPAAAREKPFAALSLPDLFRFTLAHDEADVLVRPSPRNHFAGDVYLLTSGRSSSSAAEIAALMHHLGLGTIIGEAPNGDYQGLVAEVMPVLTLPHSGIRVRMPLVRDHNAVMPVFHGEGAPPDFPLSQPIEDAIAHRDTVMLFARRLISLRRLRQVHELAEAGHR